MIQKNAGKSWALELLSSLTIASTITISEHPASAQVRPDNTLGAEQSIVNSSNRDGSRYQEIEGGAIRGSNLFHSFREFNIPEGQSLYFQNPIGIRNIIGRVTGRIPSNIEGTLGVFGGTANLFLLNPNGIIFGANARLDVRGSFVATTATGIQFGNQGFFSSSVPNSPPLLTVNPSAFLFNQIASASIINRSTAFLEPNRPPLESNRQGLQVPDGRSLLLLGGDVNFVGGGVNAAGGQLEIGAIAGRGTVGLSLNDNNLRLRFPAAIDRADISLTNGATVNASGEGGGSIQLWGRRVVVNGDSQIAAFTHGAEPGGRLIVNASESLEVIGLAAFGNISTLSFADGRAGDLAIETRRLSIRDGGQIVSGTLGNGSAGQLTVNASDSVEVAGQDGRTSFLASFTGNAGQAGNLDINTRRLIVRDGGALSASSLIASVDGQIFPVSGEGGNLTINASDSVVLIREGRIFTDTQSSGNAGNLTINTNRLLVQDGSTIGVQSQNSGNAGNIAVQARSIILRNQSQIDAETTASQGGNITIQVQDALLLRESSTISATAGTAQAGGNGGNITIDSPFVVAVPNENSDISANAFSGRGGNVEITTQGIFGIQPRAQLTPESDITASSEFGTAGTISLNTTDVDPTQGLTELPANVVDASDQIAIGCSPTATAQVNQGEFYSTGRGGIAPSPTDSITSSDILEDLQPPASWSVSTESTAQLVEAQGWQVNDRGEVMLVASTLPSPCGQ